MPPDPSVPSYNGISIRLTNERWIHITEEHAGLRLDVLETVQQPEQVLEGPGGELLAPRTVEPGKALVVVYREGDGDGFIITAIVTRRLASLKRRRQLWPP